jgi:hypothetical protein
VIKDAKMRDTAPASLSACAHSDYGQPVATARKTPQRTLVVDPTEWDELQVAAKAAGSDRATVLRAFIKWYIRRPGAKLPQRPSPADP